MTPDPGLAIGLTGGIACGKSLVGSFLEDRAIPVLDTDDVAHEVLVVGTLWFHRVVEAFGEGILAPDGSLDRKKLGALVFSHIPFIQKSFGRLTLIVIKPDNVVCHDDDDY